VIAGRRCRRLLAQLHACSTSERWRSIAAPPAPAGRDDVAPQWMKGVRWIVTPQSPIIA
jgi:hypothetical protein